MNQTNYEIADSQESTVSGQTRSHSAETKPTLAVVSPSAKSFWKVYVLAGASIVVIHGFFAPFMTLFHWMQDAMGWFSGVNDTQMGLGKWLLTVVVVLIAFVLVEILKAYKKLLIHDHHVELHVGIIARKRIKIDLSHVRGVQTDQKAIDRLLSIGPIYISGSGTGDYEIKIYGVRNPLEVRDRILSLRQSMSNGEYR